MFPAPLQTDQLNLAFAALEPGRGPRVGLGQVGRQIVVRVEGVALGTRLPGRFPSRPLLGRTGAGLLQRLEVEGQLGGAQSLAAL